MCCIDCWDSSFLSRWVPVSGKVRSSWLKTFFFSATYPSCYCWHHRIQSALIQSPQSHYWTLRNDKIAGLMAALGRRFVGTATFVGCTVAVRSFGYFLASRPMFHPTSQILISTVLSLSNTLFWKETSSVCAIFTSTGVSFALVYDWPQLMSSASSSEVH